MALAKESQELYPVFRYFLGRDHRPTLARVLPPDLADGEPGMILTVLGDRPKALKVGRPGLMQAVRWRPLPCHGGPPHDGRETLSCHLAIPTHNSIGSVMA